MEGTLMKKEEENTQTQRRRSSEDGGRDWSSIGKVTRGGTRSWQKQGMESPLGLQRKHGPANSTPDFVVIC